MRALGTMPRLCEPHGKVAAGLPGIAASSGDTRSNSQNVLFVGFRKSTPPQDRQLIVFFYPGDASPCGMTV